MNSRNKHVMENLSVLIGAVLKCAASADATEGISYWEVTDICKVKEPLGLDGETFEVDLKYLCDTSLTINPNAGVCELMQRRYQLSGRSWASPSMDIQGVYDMEDFKKLLNSYSEYTEKEEEYDDDDEESETVITSLPRRVFTSNAFSKIARETIMSNEEYYAMRKVAMDKSLSGTMDVVLVSNKEDADKLKQGWVSYVNSNPYSISLWRLVGVLGENEGVDELKAKLIQI